jgi:protein-L-isoaspartate(D-aspartate) O-methyltransferase
MTSERAALAARIDAQIGPFDPKHLAALAEVPRELFVRAEDVDRATDDTPLALDDDGLATISAPHAYLLSFRLLELTRGDCLVELGAGSGYGAALAAHIVGAEGSVVTIEIDPMLAAWAARMLAGMPNVTVMEGDAVEIVGTMRDVMKMVVTFAVTELPCAWTSALADGGVIVAPVGARDRDQRLVRVRRIGDALVRSEHGAVRYVPNRSAQRKLALQ